MDTYEGGRFFEHPIQAKSFTDHTLVGDSALTIQADAERETVFGNLRERHIVWAAMAAVIGLTLACLPFTTVAVAPFPTLAPFQAAIVMTTGGLTAALLFHRFRLSRQPSLLALAAVYLFCAEMALAQAPSFPATPALDRIRQPISWLWVAWHGGFPLGVLVHLWAGARLPSNRVARPGRASAFAIVGVTAGVGVLTIASTALDAAWPVSTSVLVGVVVCGFAALVVLARPAKSWDRIRAWLPLVITATICETFCVTIGEGAGTLFWYLAQAHGVVASGVMLILLTFETCRLHRRLLNANGLLDRAIADRTAELEAVMNAVPVAVNIADDTDCHRIIGNDYANSFFGVAPKANLSLSAPPTARAGEFRAFQYGIEVEAANLPIQRAARGETVIGWEGELVFDDGTVRPIMMNAVPLIGTDGAIRGAVGAFMDVSAQKALEAGLRAATLRAEKASAAKTRFLAAVSHDLRQPLMALRYRLHAVAAQTATAAQEQAFAQMDNALEATETMLCRVMGFAALESGMITVRREVFRLDLLVQRIVEENDDLAERKSMAIGLRGRPCWTESDPVQLGRIVRNLIVNAVRHTDRGGVLVGIRRRGAALRVEVWDTGPGIPPDRQDTIFEEFRRFDTPGRAPTTGQGLGLSIVAKTAEALGHPLFLRSRVGRGSVFAIEVPRAEPPAAASVPDPVGG